MMMMTSAALLLSLTTASARALHGAAGGGKATRTQQEFYVSNLEYGNVLPQFHWTCKTHGGEFNPSGYCRVADDPPYVEAHPMLGPCKVETDPTCPDHAFTGLWNHSRAWMLPYTVQDSYDRAQTRTKLDVIELESATLKATITPQYGGRLWSLVDKRTGKEVFHNNRYVQPNNDALRQAYLQGGCEWNFGSQMGHMMQTADLISAAILSTERGDVVRVFAFERISKATWQVDMLIEEAPQSVQHGHAAPPSSSGTLYVHIKLTNPNPHPITGYWWTNIGIPHDRVPLPGDPPASELPPAPVDTRILTPAKNWISDASLAAYPPWPTFIGSNWMQTGAWKGVESDGDWTFPKQHAFDHSYLKNWWEKCDVWLSDESVLERHVNYNGYITRNGSSMLHAHPNNGTKAWVWGQAPNERYWQDFGGGPANYNYNTELQTGVMPTQYQGFPMAAGEVREWTELIMPIPELGSERTAKLYDDDYHGVVIEEVEGLMAARGIGQRNSSHYDAMDAWLTKVGKRTPKPSEMVASQQGWAGLEMRRRGLSSLAEGTVFAMPGEPAGGTLDDETRPWAELLTDGTFSAATLAKHVTSFMVDPAWLALIDASASKHGATWLHHYHLGIGALEVVANPLPTDPSFVQAVAHFEASLKLKTTAEAHRSLAITTSSQGQFDTAHAHYMAAMATATAASDADPAGQALLVRNLGAEIAQYLRLVAVGTSQDYGPAPAALAPHLLPELAKFVAANNTMLTPAVRKEDRFRMAEIASALRYDKNYTRVFELADCAPSHQWPTLGFELALMKAWYHIALVEQAAERAGRPLSLKERHALIRKNPVPLCLRAIGH